MAFGQTGKKCDKNKTIQDDHRKQSDNWPELRLCLHRCRALLIGDCGLQLLYRCNFLGSSHGVQRLTLRVDKQRVRQMCPIPRFLESFRNFLMGIHLDFDSTSRNDHWFKLTSETSLQTSGLWVPKKNFLPLWLNPGHPPRCAPGKIQQICFAPLKLACRKHDKWWPTTSVVHKHLWVKPNQATLHQHASRMVTGLSSPGLSSRGLSSPGLSGGDASLLMEKLEWLPSMVSQVQKWIDS